MRFGYACLNGTLRDEGYKRKKLQKKDFEQGLHKVVPVTRQNLNMVIVTMDWNHRHGLELLRVTDLFPWMDKYKLEDLPEWDSINGLLIQIGQVAEDLNHRITVHPSSFCVLASPTGDCVKDTILELDQNSRIFDLMGFPRNHFNKINIHIGGTYGDKEATMARFCENFKSMLSEGTQSRLTIENDDRPNGYTVEDLYSGVYQRTGIPIVLDLFHHQLNPGNLTEREAIEMALSTWKAEETPIIHISSSKRDHDDASAAIVAHSEYIHRSLPDLPRDVDIMVEAKKTELAAIDLMKKHMERT